MSEAIDLANLPPAVRAAFVAKGRQCAASRAIISHRCALCGATFDGLVVRRYCSDACRQAAYRVRVRRA